MVNPCNIITDEEKEKIDEKYDPSNIFIKGYKQDKWYKNYEENSNSQPEKTAAERVKLRKQKADDEENSKRRKMVKNINSKQTINYAFNTISKSKCWKQLKKIKRRNQAVYFYFINTIKSLKMFTQI